MVHGRVFLGVVFFHPGKRPRQHTRHLLGCGACSLSRLDETIGMPVRNKVGCAGNVMVHRPARNSLMNVASTALLALAMSTDAFAAAVGQGAHLHKPRILEALNIGLLFGVKEGLTPVVGWRLGTGAAPYVAAGD